MNFKLGDKVTHWAHGEGVIRRFETGGVVGIDFGPAFTAGHNLEGTLETETGWYVESTDIMSEVKRDNINPQHYKAGGIETIDYMKAKMPPAEFRGYLLGNVMKYTSRAHLKNGQEDLKKAQWYLNKLIEEGETQNG